MENWRNASTLSDKETSACRFQSSTSSAHNVPSRSIPNNPPFQGDPNRNVQGSKSYNWRESSQMEKEINFRSSNRKLSNWRGSSEINNERNLDRPRSYYSLNFLVEIGNQNSSIIILDLIWHLNDFARFLESDMEEDWITLTIAILSKVCSSSFRYNKLAILETAAEASFLQKIEKFVGNVKSEESAKPGKNQLFWENTEEFFVNLLFVCESFVEVTSDAVSEVMPKLLEAIDRTVTHLNLKLNKKTKLNIKTLIKKFNLSGHENAADSNFRLSNIVPTSAEILTQSCVAPSKCFVEGKYDNVDQYLEVQFRLRKESFIASLREDISQGIEYVNNIGSSKKLCRLTIYTNVVFQSIISNYKGVGIKLKFSDRETTEKIFSPDNVRHFQFGELVLLANDNFLSVSLGRVIRKDCEEQYLMISIEPEYNYDFNATYTIIRLIQFFEPYFYGLKTLQCISEVDFPMKKYLVDEDRSEELPGYLNGIHGSKLDFFGNNWPSAEQLKLDSSQYSAFKAALTQKFNVIQGFPGTGKTYLGLQIVKTLLHEDNKKIWYNGTPILVVSASNQALDTFLKGLISTTSKIIRIGENVKNKELEKFLLSNSTTTENYDYYIVRDTWVVKIKKLLKETKELISHINQIKKTNVIVNFTHFEIIDENIKTSWFSKVSNADLHAWLFDGRESQNINQHSIKISDIIDDIIEEEKNFGCDDDKTASDEEPTVSTEPGQTFLFSQPHMWIEIVLLTKKLRNVKPQDNSTDYVKKLETRLINLWQTYQYFKTKMSDRAVSQPPTKPIAVDYDSPLDMDSDDRWNLYFHWLNQYIGFVENRSVELRYKHRDLHNNLDEIKKIFDLEIIQQRNPLVLGMTTQAAPRCHTTLQALGCRIIVVEEASEVLESELLPSLTKHCEHLILLGDHQKFRPNMNSSMSLMERMVINKMQCHVLEVQHRMSVKISQLLVPGFFSKFDGYPSVTECPSILGIQSPIFFVHQEPRDVDEHTTREYYLYEAKFLINLARYMRQLGCEPEDITILASEFKQMQILCNESKKYEDLFRGIRICTLGKFQGQECKVILLSLVKNNYDGKIGYLKKESSVIFALSRAKEYLFMMGNMDLLCQDNETWSKIKKVLLEQNCLGNYFPLCCQNNPDHIIQIKEPEDFDRIPKGACSEICESPKINCNYIDPKDFQCPTPVKITLPCGHETTQKPPNIDVNEWACSFPCDARIEPCGHSCIRTCHDNYDPDHTEYKCYKKCDRILKDCATKTHRCQKYCCQKCSSCRVIVTKKLDCNHIQAIECSESGNVMCVEPCGKKIAKCGHDCKNRCCEPCGGCEEMVLKTLPFCGHQVWTKCYEPADVQNCDGPCPKLLPCGHPCLKKCNEVCTEHCHELINHPQPKYCGHEHQTDCFMRTTQILNYTDGWPLYCDEPCTAILACSHKCSGTCGECAQGRIHVTCMEKCGMILICGHECTISCREECQPCKLKCGMKCSHNKCTKMCEEVCTRCQESCTRRCIHAECTAKCGDICTVPPCQVPCEKKLPCSHPCVGFCGDPCPPLCRICNAAELGPEDKDDARFVLLDECKHVVESTAMESLCEEARPNGIHFIRCPKCWTQLSSTQRYNDYIKRTMDDVAVIKRKGCGTLEEIEEKRKELQEKIVELRGLQFTELFTQLSFLDKFINDCSSLLEPINSSKKLSFDLAIGKSLQAKLTIVLNIGQIWQVQKLNHSGSSTPSFLDLIERGTYYVEYLLRRLTEQLEKITKQEIQDFERELVRLQRIFEFLDAAESSSPKDSTKLKELLYTSVIYTEDYDKIVKASLEWFTK